MLTTKLAVVILPLFCDRNSQDIRGSNMNINPVTAALNQQALLNRGEFIISSVNYEI